MSRLREELSDYLTLTRSMGYKLRRAEKLLAQFLAFCEAAGTDTVTIDLALAWATLPEAASTGWVCHRLGGGARLQPLPGIGRRPQSGRPCQPGASPAEPGHPVSLHRKSRC
jgi:hypothetical protein